VDRKKLTRLLERVRSGSTGVTEAIEQLRRLPYEKLGFATLDLHRAVRRGFPEVVFGPGKTPQQIARIVECIAAAGQTVLVTRVGADVFEQVSKVVPGVEYHELARAIVRHEDRGRKGRPGVVVVTAGTADLPVAAEAALTAELMGNQVERINDVGVAGVHRLFDHLEALQTARAIVVVAGMEGALPSLVAGLTDCPVIGVPTSVGYGAGGAGVAALLAMLSSCAAGLTVVNIDNGFGAGFAAGLINRPARATRKNDNS
jgi:NCAIR mutase (PurE)-related protein